MTKQLMFGATSEQIQKFNVAWKIRSPECKNRSSFIKKAINEKLGEEIFDVELNINTS